MPASAVVAWAFIFVVNIFSKPTSLNQSQSIYSDMNCGRKNRERNSMAINISIILALYGM